MNNIERGKDRIIKIFTTWRFLFFLIWKLPMGFLAKLRVVKLDMDEAVITAPHNYWNKNPFNSMYFAVQAMAGELSTGVLTLLHSDGKNISTLVTNLEAKYYKQATTKIKFICLDGNKISIAIQDAFDTGEPKLCEVISKGYDINGVCVSEFHITWSFKKRQ